MSIKKIGMQNGRELFEAKIRKGHEAFDLAEIIAFQGRTSGKQRYKINLDDFTDKEAEELIHMMQFLNYYRNTSIRKNNPVIYYNMELHLA